MPLANPLPGNRTGPNGKSLVGNGHIPLPLGNDKTFLKRIVVVIAHRTTCAEHRLVEKGPRAVKVFRAQHVARGNPTAAAVNGVAPREQTGVKGADVDAPIDSRSRRDAHVQNARRFCAAIALAMPEPQWTNNKSRCRAVGSRQALARLGAVLRSQFDLPTQH